MATKYVENYRVDKTKYDAAADTEAIQLAINDIDDGDTIEFEAGRTYTLNAQIRMLKCYDSEGNITERTKKYITFNGNGCTIQDDPSFVITADFNTPGSLQPWFSYSDEKNTLEFSVIKNFNFSYQGLTGEEEIEKKRYTAISHACAGNGTQYAKNCIIEGCSFTNIYTGIHIAGDNDTIRNCTFLYCMEGINMDCPNNCNIHSNYFDQSRYEGIKATQPNRSSIHDNTFENSFSRCITVVGNSDVSEELRLTSLNIYGNRMWHGDPNTNLPHAGIYLSNIKDVTIRDNFIRDVYYSNISGEICGYGIVITGTYNHNPTFFSERIIVTNNNINNCMKGGIYCDMASSCKITDNIITSGMWGAGADYGICIKERTGNFDVNNNSFYYHSSDKIINSNSYGTINFQNNAYVKEEGEFLPLARFITTTLSNEYTYMIEIPSTTASFENNEIFYMYVPSGYLSASYTLINYNGNSYFLYNGDNQYYSIPSSSKGKYVKVIFNSVIDEEGNNNCKFTAIN